ncbi:MAG: hypothetical protein IKH04_00935 [Kiritimatiellae bacterium]|nr:hypothetical protein [Kiritimatiellia bacterium]
MMITKLWKRDRAVCVFMALALAAATLYGGSKPPATPTPWGRMLCAAVSRDVSWLIRPLQHFKPLFAKEQENNE